MIDVVVVGCCLSRQKIVVINQVLVSLSRSFVHVAARGCSIARDLPRCCAAMLLPCLLARCYSYTAPLVRGLDVAPLEVKWLTEPKILRVCLVGEKVWIMILYHISLLLDK